MKYKCLILDHDDTAVDSTRYIHYPSFVAALKELRPEAPVLTLNEFVNYCFNPGFNKLCTDIIKFTPEEQSRQQEIWRQYNRERIAKFFPGFPELIKQFKEQGGIITVVSHSESAMVKSDYMRACGFEPDAVYGWELGKEKIKPNPYPVLQILNHFRLQPKEALILDDSRLGLEMANKCNVPFAAAGWSPKNLTIQKWMRENSPLYFDHLNKLVRYIE